MDGIPVVSQLKSAVQALSGDTKGARKTQERFVKTCPIVSQTYSLKQIAVDRDYAGAINTQLEFGKWLWNIADSVPVLGHAKGGIHYACGDKEGGDKAMKRSSRTTGVIGGGVIGFGLCGPACAAAGGIAGGLALDGITTAVDSKIRGHYRPSGTIAAVSQIAKGKSESVSGDICDIVGGTISDAWTGYWSGELYARKRRVGVEGKFKLKKQIPAEKQHHISGLLDDLKSLKGSVIKKMQEVRPRYARRKQHTAHKFHGLGGDRQGQIAADLVPSAKNGIRGPERVIFETKSNYSLRFKEFCDRHNYFKSR